MSEPPIALSEPANSSLNAVEERCVSLFREGAKLLGLPKSMGEIYGLMYVTDGPLSLNDLVKRLQISKGSASQGLKALRQLGAVVEEPGTDQRRMHYRAAVDLKSLIGGFIRSEVRPHLESSRDEIAGMEELVAKMDDEAEAAFYCERVERLQRWSGRAGVVLPLIQRVMGG